ncbi:hypothetical protein J5Y09_04800 [Roseomonas sp. PWR1]|uniref:J domain-containing protein n=1 Tax=Roseomonas nitratireducens TaxID=2820810 RepID=A0ABS4APD8_9PROT|nr:hypothetical protein [Neoroseomonas nitratireducens]MBP0463220.1 hypothetical protein [Neoroseomonas nitratireducens]
MESERPFREWPIEQLAEQALLHPGDRRVLEGLAKEAGLRPGVRAKALEARIARMLDGIAVPPRGAGVQELREMLATAAREIDRLRARLKDAEKVQVDPQRAAAGEAVGDPGPHRRVYLTPNAPAWLVAEVRRAFRRRYHPDAQQEPARRGRAEEVFKRAEAVFEEIERLRES